MRAAAAMAPDDVSAVAGAPGALKSLFYRRHETAKKIRIIVSKDSSIERWRGKRTEQRFCWR